MSEPLTQDRTGTGASEPTAVHAEHVGSLLRPRSLLDTRGEYKRGNRSVEQLRAVEDEAVLTALELQREAGLEVFTDGEYRRGSWLALWWEAFDGIVEVDEPAMRIEWHDLPDESISQDELQLKPIVVGDRLRRKLPLTEIEADFLLAHAPGQVKITMPSPNMTATLWQAGQSQDAYPTPADLLADVARLQIAEINALADRGVSWIQIDSLRYLSFLDPGLRTHLESLGLDLERELAQTVELDNQVIRAAHARGMTVGLHLCRGNNRSAWMATGSYEPVAEQLFAGVEADRFLLEYDTERAGGFEPLRFIPDDTRVVLGLVSTKTPVLESADDMRRRIEDAGRFVAIGDLALSPQCGFASTMEGNALTVDEQQRKLELVVRTAAEVWG